MRSTRSTRPFTWNPRHSPSKLVSEAVASAPGRANPSPSTARRSISRWEARRSFQARSWCISRCASASSAASCRHSETAAGQVPELGDGEAARDMINWDTGHSVIQVERRRTFAPAFDLPGMEGPREDGILEGLRSQVGAASLLGACRREGTGRDWFGTEQAEVGARQSGAGVDETGIGEGQAFFRHLEQHPEGEPLPPGTLVGELEADAALVTQLLALVEVQRRVIGSMRRESTLDEAKGEDMTVASPEEGERGVQGHALTLGVRGGGRYIEELLKLPQEVGAREHFLFRLAEPRCGVLQVHQRYYLAAPGARLAPEVVGVE